MWSQIVTTYGSKFFDITICDNEYNSSKVADCDLREFEMTDVCGRKLRPHTKKIKFEVAICDLIERKGEKFEVTICDLKLKKRRYGNTGH